MNQRLCHHQAALHATGELAHPGIFLVAQSERFEDLVRASFAFWNAVKARHQLHAFTGGEERVHVDFLRHNTQRGSGFARVLVDVISPDLRYTTRLVHQPGQDVDHGGLARAIGAEQAEDRSTRNLEIDTLQGALGTDFP